MSLTFPWAPPDKGRAMPLPLLLTPLPTGILLRSGWWNQRGPSQQVLFTGELLLDTCLTPVFPTTLV